MKILFIFFFPFFIACSAQETNNYLPQSEGEIVHHTYYSLSYNESAEQANWVFYHINSNNTLGQYSRTDDFRSDNAVSTGSAQLLDYKNSGFDRGHLAPANDMSFNHIAMSESFYMSNMSPQHPSFNRGIWKQLEELVRNWGRKSSIYVVTGPILSACSTSIGANHVCVPEYFYKVIFNPNEQKMVSFILPNKKGEKKLIEYVCTTNTIEQITNIDFFSFLEDNLEEKLESGIITSNWDWTTNITNTHYETNSVSSAVQCQGITAKGLQCKNRTTNPNGYCHHHD